MPAPSTLRRVRLLGPLTGLAFFLSAGPFLPAQTYTYDPAGRLTRVAYPDGKGVSYAYDDGGNLTSVLPLNLPPAPKNLEVTPSGDSAVALSWQDAGNSETGYAVQRRGNDNYDWETIATLPANATSYTDSAIDPTQAYLYRIQASGANGVSALSAAAPTPASIAGGQLFNISTRATVGTGGNILIPGFVISGSAGKTVLIRGVGPTLGTFGVEGVLEDPVLTVFDKDKQIVADNDNWQDSPNAEDLMAAAAQVGAFPLEADSRDAATLVALEPGAYTVQVAGVASTTGISLVEVYDTTPDSGSRLVNISGRAVVGTGPNILIPGIVIDGESSRQLLIRAVGPTLTGFGVNGALVNPAMTVFNKDGTPVAQNENWNQNTNASEIRTVSAQVGAFALAEGSADAAVLVTLEPGSYTIQVSGVNGSTGVALIEVYEVN